MFFLAFYLLTDEIKEGTLKALIACEEFDQVDLEYLKMKQKEKNFYSNSLIKNTLDEKYFKRN